MTTPEGKVKAKVNARLAPYIASGYIWKFMPVQTGYGMAALDYILCANGRFAVIETKAAGEPLTPRQVTTANNMRKAGGIVMVVDDDASLNRCMDIIAALVNETTPYDVLWTMTQ